MESRRECLEPIAYDIAGVAQRYSISARTVRRWIQNGLPYFQQSHRTKVLIRREDLDQFMAQRLVISKVDLNDLVETTVNELTQGRKPTVVEKKGKGNV